jgi:predicted ribosomally synthesized peptide with nif11-like leader
MSQEKLQAFAEAVSKSEELQKQFALIQLETIKSIAEKLAKLSESAGTPFTAEEYLKAIAPSSEEMSTEQLRSVAGGGGDPIWMNIVSSLADAFTHGGTLDTIITGGGNLCVVRGAQSLIEGGTAHKCWDSTPPR